MNLTTKKITMPPKFIGLKFAEFERLTREGGTSGNGLISVRKARLIPSYKMGDELHLASITLSSMSLIKEFREQIFSLIGMKRQGSHYFYTEIAINEKGLNDCRFDGLILQVVKGEIRDAVFLEFKGTKASIEPNQIERYLNFIKANFKGASKLVTVSSEFVADVSHTPFELPSKVTRGFNLAHLSWSHIKTIAHLLLFDNDENIEDTDQIALMREVLEYFEDEKVGLANYTSMSSGWANVVKAIKEKTKPSKEDLEECAKSWIEEQTDMAHLLSKHLGVAVKTSSAKGETSLSKRLKAEVAKLEKTSTLSFDLNIKGSYSEINVIADFETSFVTMSVQLTPPLTSDKKGRARLKWLLVQLLKCQKINGEAFSQIQSNLFVETRQKYFSNVLRTNVSQFSEVETQLDLSKDIVQFNVLMQRDLKKKFSSGKGFVMELEQMLFNFYSIVVQNLTSWTAPQPKMHQEEVE
jgi:hypothetical protein